VKRQVGIAFWLESCIALVTAAAATLTLVWRDWIETLFGFDPDHHNGSFELELTIVCLAITLLTATLARRQWRRAALL
jgi:DMSO/TMAO reductase YedYZ heme-binding membrane subunit